MRGGIRFFGRCAGALPLVVVWALPAVAEPLSGLCPDGSIFIVQRPADIPCPRAKLVEASELPPLRPELLPRPYKWMVDQEARNPNNPYNLIDSAQRIRELRAGEGGDEPAPVASAPAVAPPPPAVGPRLAPGEARDLMRLVDLRQQLAPAEIRVTDALGDLQLEIRFAHSAAFEQRLLDQLALDPAGHRVLAFTAHAHEPTEFYPSFFVVQNPLTFRPESTDPHELGILVGQAGALDRGAFVAGYVVVPGRFDPSRDLDLFWNDRSVSSVLAP